MVKKLLMLAAMLGTFLGAHAFGKIGHDAVAYIAECNLTPTAKAEIERYLGGKSIVYYANLLDKVRLTPEYKHTDGWHSASVDSLGRHKLWKERYHAYIGINSEMERIEDGKYKQMNDSAVASSIKILTHIVGDMHTPGHTFFENKSQNIDFTVGKLKTRFHKFWDEEIFNLAHAWQYPEYQYQLDRCTPQEKAEMTKGTLVDWIEDNARTVRPLYDIITPGAEFSQGGSDGFVERMSKVMEGQVLKAGYRLAHVLNSVFDPNYPKWERE